MKLLRRFSPMISVLATVCLALGSSAASAFAAGQEAIKAAEYSAGDPSQEEPNLDNWVLILKQDPTVTGYAIGYGGPRQPGDGKEAATKAVDYAVTQHGVDPSRLVAVDGGSRDAPSVELWIVPEGAAVPAPTPAKP